MSNHIIKRTLRLETTGDEKNPESHICHSKQALVFLSPPCYDEHMSESPPTNPTPLPYKIGSEKLIRVTETAAQRLQQVLQKSNRTHGALRIAVIGGGCSGLQYKMDIVDGPRPKDYLVTSQGVNVVVDPKSALFVSGSALDYSDDLQKGGFKVTNPNATAHCSCGESFAA